MDLIFFHLGNSEKNRLINIMKIIFGIACFVVAMYWLIFGIKTNGSSGSVWITIIFLTGFGFYEIWSGLGKADRYIEIGQDKIHLKKFIFLAPVEIKANDTEKIELFSLKIVFHFKTGRNIVLRLGTTYYDTNEKIADEIARFSEGNKIAIEIISEEI